MCFASLQFLNVLNLCKLKPFHECKALISFKFANKDLESGELPQNYVCIV